MKRIGEKKQSLITNNKSMAEYNLSKEPRLTQAKSQLADTYTQAVNIQKDFEKNKQKFGNGLIITYTTTIQKIN